MSRAALQTRDLRCGYSGRDVLTNVNLSVAAGEVLALIGPNGSGKSTLLRTLCGLLPPLGGHVELLGASISRMTPRDVARTVALVPPEESVEFPFTVREIVCMGRYPHSEGLFDTAEDLRIADEAMQEAGCFELAHRPIGQISAGERQRAILARALAQRAPILLLDEPTSHLDAAHQVAFADLIRQLANRGLAIAAALHDLNLAAQVASQVMVLAGGRVACEGKVDEILRSEALDRAFGVSFERIGGADEGLRLHPQYRR